MTYSLVWLKDDFRISNNQAISALIDDKSTKKKLYIFMTKMNTFFVKHRNGGLLNL